tara:strand:- start:1522 stop:1956 length:435 start_codon:yes stop_codon:yes gene_type:complete
MNIIAKKFNKIYSIIELYKSFNKYKYTSNEELFFYLLTTLDTKQYKVFYTDDNVTGFISWCYLDTKNEKIFLDTGEILDWNCGDIVWLVDFVAKDNIKSIIKWTKDYFANKLKINQRVNYVRMDNEFNIYRISSQSNKEFYRHG